MTENQPPAGGPEPMPGATPPSEPATPVPPSAGTYPATPVPPSAGTYPATPVPDAGSYPATPVPDAGAYPATPVAAPGAAPAPAPSPAAGAPVGAPFGTPAGTPPGAPFGTPEPAAPAPPPGTYPAGVFPATPGAYPAAPGGAYVPDQPPLPAKKGRGGIVAAAAAGVVALGALFLKFGLPLLIGTAASGILGGVFGGPFEKLPGDQKQALEQRFDKAVGNSLDGLSDDASTAKVQGLIDTGLPRLGDELLVDRLVLSARLTTAADLATCAQIARGGATGSGDREATSKAVGAMETADIGRWYEINVSAIEAGAAGTPEARTPDDAEVSRIINDVFGGFDATATANIQALFGGDVPVEQTTDEQACGAVRSLYGALAALPDADRAVMALYDVTP